MSKRKLQKSWANRFRTALGAAPMSDDAIKTSSHPQPGSWAVARNVRVPARKARLVADLIRGQEVPKAQAILQFTSRAAVQPIQEVLRSAVASAQQNLSLEPDQLYVHTIFVDEGPTIKRFMPRAQGKAGRIRKRSSHITVFVAPQDALENSLLEVAKK